MTRRSPSRPRAAKIFPMRVEEAESRLGVSFPPGLAALYAVGDGRFDQRGQWWVVWPLDRLVENNAARWHEGMLARDLLAFGDDGTGNPFCVSLVRPRDEVLRWSWIEGEVEQSAGTFADFVHEWLDVR